MVEKDGAVDYDEMEHLISTELVSPE